MREYIIPNDISSEIAWDVSKEKENSNSSKYSAFNNYYFKRNIIIYPI